MKATKVSKKAYTRHSAEYKTEALKLAERIGVPDAARQLGLHESQLYQWKPAATPAKCQPSRTGTGY